MHAGKPTQHGRRRTWLHRSCRLLTQVREGRRAGVSSCELAQKATQPLKSRPDIVLRSLFSSRPTLTTAAGPTTPCVQHLPASACVATSPPRPAKPPHLSLRPASDAHTCTHTLRLQGLPTALSEPPVPLRLQPSPLAPAHLTPRHPFQTTPSLIWLLILIEPLLQLGPPTPTPGNALLHCFQVSAQMPPSQHQGQGLRPASFKESPPLHSPRTPPPPAFPLPTWICGCQDAGETGAWKEAVSAQAQLLLLFVVCTGEQLSALMKRPPVGPRANKNTAEMVN